MGDDLAVQNRLEGCLNAPYDPRLSLDPVRQEAAAVTPPRRPYATDLTDAEWRLLVPLIPAAKSGGRPAIHDHRELVNAMAYWLQARCAWQLLPHDLPPWQTEPGSGVPPSPSPSRSAPSSSASPGGPSSSRPA